jgi:type 1 fimbria pilin
MEGGDMRGRRWLVLAVCLFVVVPESAAVKAAGNRAVEAEGGTITFVGAVLEPTCAINATNAAAVMDGASIAPSPQHSYACTGNASISTADVAASRRYSLTVTHLTDAEADPVLRYFDGYVRASSAEAPNPVLLTQVYE